MKKLLCLILSVIISAVLLTFSACSCKDSTLSFQNKWDKLANNTNCETLTYTVNYSDNYNNEADYSKTSKYSDLVIEIYGEYVVKTQYIGYNDLVEKIGNNSNILSSYKQGPFMAITSELTLHSKYTLNDKTEEFDEFINTESYSLDLNNSLAPIYSFSESKYAVIAIHENSLVINKMHYISKTDYNKSSYKGVIKTYNFDDEITEETTPKTKESYKGNFTTRTAIDNNALLFAIRNSDLSGKTGQDFKVLSPSYQGIIDVNAKIQKTTKDYLDEKQISVSRVEFAKTGTASGTPQIVFLQKEPLKDDNGNVIEDRTLPVKMVTPLTEHSLSYYKIGCLIYSLTERAYS